jgi:hypothetical protein
VARDNTITYAGRRLQLPASPLRSHYVKAIVKVREYPDGTPAVFHGPWRIARYDAQGTELLEVPTAPRLTPCSPPSRRGLAMPERAESARRRPALTAAARGVPAQARVGTKKRLSGRTKKLSAQGSHQPRVRPDRGLRIVHRFRSGMPSTRSGQMVCYENRTT